MLKAEFVGRGRPSLSGAQAHSPHVAARVSPRVKRAAEQLASERGISVSQLLREVLENFLETEGKMA